MRAQSEKRPVQGVRRGEDMPARSDKEHVQGVRRGEHLPARTTKEQMQGMRRGEHLPAQSGKEPVQGVRRVEHLPARSDKEAVQGVRRGEHLPAQPHKEQVQDVHSRQGRVHAAGSRGALRHTHTSLCSGKCLLPPAWIFRFRIRHTDASCAHGLVHDLKNFPFRSTDVYRTVAAEQNFICASRGVI